MTEYIEQTSASDRLEAARAAKRSLTREAGLLDFIREYLDLIARPEGFIDGTGKRYTLEQADLAMWNAVASMNEAILSLRALITPPTTHESLSDLALKIHAAALTAAEDAGIQITTDLDSIMRNATNRAVCAGMQGAHESWEPEVAQRPSQEQMLRWLGVRYTESAEQGYVYIPLQQIEREEI